MYSQLQHIHNMSSNNLIRVNFIVDKDSNSFPIEKDWLKYNDGNKYSLYSVVYEMHENYPAIVVSIKSFRHMDIARRMSEGRGLCEILSYLRWDVNLYHQEKPFGNGNIIDLYLNPGENCYYLDRECTNAVILMIFAIKYFTLIFDPKTILRPCPTGLRDKFLKKYYRAFDNDSMLMISTNEDRETMMGRIRRIVPLYMAEEGISECIYKWEEGCVIYSEDNMKPGNDAVIYIR